MDPRLKTSTYRCNICNTEVPIEHKITTILPRYNPAAWCIECQSLTPFTLLESTDKMRPLPEIAITHQSKHKSFDTKEKLRYDEVKQRQVDAYLKPDSPIKTIENKPVAWRVNNSAGVWIYFTSKMQAEVFYRTYFGSGDSQIQPLYLYPF